MSQYFIFIPQVSFPFDTPHLLDSQGQGKAVPAKDPSQNSGQQASPEAIVRSDRARRPELRTGNLISLTLNLTHLPFCLRMFAKTRVRFQKP